MIILGAGQPLTLFLPLEPTPVEMLEIRAFIHGGPATEFVTSLIERQARTISAIIAVEKLNIPRRNFIYD